MSRKNAAGVEVDDTASDAPAPENTPTIAASAAPVTEEKPSEGGSYTRQADGSLIRNTDGGSNG
jgi:hypothetical protein